MRASGFSLHAATVCEADEREKLERLCRYVARPALANARLSLDGDGTVRYELKRPFRDGTTHVVLTPLEFLSRLAALVPRPRVNLVRYHGLFAPKAASAPGSSARSPDARATTTRRRTARPVSAGRFGCTASSRSTFADAHRAAAGCG